MGKGIIYFERRPYLQYCFCENPRGREQSILRLYFSDHLRVLRLFFLERMLDSFAVFCIFVLYTHTDKYI